MKPLILNGRFVFVLESLTWYFMHRVMHRVMHRALQRAIANLIAKLREIMSRRNSSGKENSSNPIRQGSNQPKKITLSRAPSAAELKCAEVIMIKTVQAESKY